MPRILKVIGCVLHSVTRVWLKLGCFDGFFLHIRLKNTTLEDKTRAALRVSRAQLVWERGLSPNAVCPFADSFRCDGLLCGPRHCEHWDHEAPDASHRGARQELRFSGQEPSRGSLHQHLLHRHSWEPDAHRGILQVSLTRCCSLAISLKLTTVLHVQKKN